MKMTNVSGQRLCFPDGIELMRGESRDVTDSEMKNIGIKAWVNDGWLEKAEASPKKQSKQEAEADAAKAAAEAELMAQMEAEEKAKADAAAAAKAKP
jgi:hypothetical protein